MSAFLRQLGMTIAFTPSSVASAFNAIGRVSRRTATDAAARIDQRVGLHGDGFVSHNELIAFQAALLSGGQGLGVTSLTARRMVATSIALHTASLTTADRFVRVPVARTAPAPAPVRISSLSGTVQVRSTTGQVVLEMSRSALAKRIAGAGATELKLSDFQRASPFLTRNEHALAAQLANETLFASTLGATTSKGQSPGGREIAIDTEARGSMTGWGGAFAQSTTHAHRFSMKLGRDAALLDEQTGVSYAAGPDGYVRLPYLPKDELTVISRGVNAKILETFRLQTA